MNKYWLTVKYYWVIAKLLWKEYRNAGQEDADPDDNNRNIGR